MRIDQQKIIFSLFSILVQTPVGIASKLHVTDKLQVVEKYERLPVARLKKDKRNDGYVELDTPLIVGRGPEGFGLMPYMMTVNPESTVTIKMEHILSMGKTNDEISKGYTKQTSKIETL